MKLANYYNHDYLETLKLKKAQLATKGGVYKCPNCGTVEPHHVRVEKALPETLPCYKCTGIMLPTWKELKP